MNYQKNDFLFLKLDFLLVYFFINIYIYIFLFKFLKNILLYNNY